jgi:hypothetical protein
MVRLNRALSPDATRWYDKLCIPAIRFMEQRVRVPVGKNILLVAKKISA